MTYFISGQYNALCDRCGFKFKSSELKKDWQGLMVCEEDYETRHPQDFIKVRTEKVLPEWVRPRPQDSFRMVEGFRESVPILEYEEDSYIEPGYFLEDYIKDGLYLLMAWNRPFEEVVPIADSLDFFAIGTEISDPLSVVDSLSLILTGSAFFTDNLAIVDAGDAYLNNYVDPTYFSEFYVGEQFLF